MKAMRMGDLALIGEARETYFFDGLAGCSSVSLPFPLLVLIARGRLDWLDCGVERLGPATSVATAERSSDSGSLSFPFPFSFAALTRALERKLLEVDEEDGVSRGTCSELGLLDSGLCWDKSI